MVEEFELVSRQEAEGAEAMKDKILEEEKAV